MCETILPADGNEKNDPLKIVVFDVAKTVS